MARKNGQVSGANAATLVALIGLFILLYILFLPPQERQDLLDDGDRVNGGSTGTSNDTFLLEHPGSLDDLNNENIEHIIPSVNLFATESAKVLASINSIMVKRNLITEKTANFTFDIGDVKNTNNILVTFLAKVRKGTLTVKINGKEIFYGDVPKENLDPLRLQSDMLVHGKNTLSFSVSSPGWKIWRTNQYTLEGLQITADVTDTTQQRSQNIFVISTTELNNLERAYLRFTPECLVGQVGTLNVQLNGKNIYGAVPDCGAPALVEFSSEHLRNNENTLIFTTDKGNYLIDLIKLTSTLKQGRQPIYFFNIPKNVYDKAVIEKKYKIFLHMKFVDGVNMKDGVIIVNGREFGLFQREQEFEKDITTTILEGNNAIKILPKNSLEIITLEVVAE